jgi:hypothetical protein
MVQLVYFCIQGRMTTHLWKYLNSDYFCRPNLYTSPANRVRNETIRLRAHRAPFAWRFACSVVLSKAPCETLYLYGVHTKGSIPLSAELVQFRKTLPRHYQKSLESCSYQKVFLWNWKIEENVNGFTRLVKKRPTFGEFYHLYRDARVHPDKSIDYLRMSKETSDTLLKRLELHLSGPGTNYRESISAEQRLIVTVR